MDWSRRARPVARLVLFVAILAGGTLEAAAGPSPTYRSPVSPATAVITDHFRAPPNAYAAGNRGLDYATVPGAIVMAAAAGRVVFAGSVGGALHVTIAHPDGLRSSYSFLARILVAAGDQVDQGQPIGVTGSAFHFGVRTPDGTYLDPEAVFAGREGSHLVAGPDDGASASASGIGGERRMLAAIVAADGPARADRPRPTIDERAIADPAMSMLSLALELDRWQRSQRDCTPSSMGLPVPTERRIAVLVAPAPGEASATAIDAATLGYAPPDVVRFPVAPVAAHDVADNARRLEELLTSVAAAHPGVPIDVIALAGGGEIAVLAVDQAMADGTLAPQVKSIVTIASPAPPSGIAVPGPGSDAAGSDAPRWLSIGASGDAVVPWIDTLLPGSPTVLVHLTGRAASARLAGAAATTREIAQVVAGRRPTCQPRAQGLLDVVTSHVLALATGALP